MKQNRLIQTTTVEVRYDHLQAFQYFLTKLWQEVEISNIIVCGDGTGHVDLDMDSRLNSGLIYRLWEDWKASLIYEAYAVMN